MRRARDASGSPCHHEPVALLKVKNPRTVVVLQLAVGVVTMFVFELVFTDDSAVAALVTSVFTAIFVVACLWWLARRSRA